MLNLRDPRLDEFKLAAGKLTSKGGAYLWKHISGDLIREKFIILISQHHLYIKRIPFMFEWTFEKYDNIANSVDEILYKCRQKYGNRIIIEDINVRKIVDYHFKCKNGYKKISKRIFLCSIVPFLCKREFPHIKKFRIRYGLDVWNKDNNEWFSKDFKRMIEYIFLISNYSHPKNDLYKVPKDVLINNIIPFLEYNDFQYWKRKRMWRRKVWKCIKTIFGRSVWWVVINIIILWCLFLIYKVYCLDSVYRNDTCNIIPLTSKFYYLYENSLIDDTDIYALNNVIKYLNDHSLNSNDINFEYLYLRYVRIKISHQVFSFKVKWISDYYGTDMDFFVFHTFDFLSSFSNFFVISVLISIDCILSLATNFRVTGQYLLYDPKYVLQIILFP